jgi:hypothetical protein
LGTKAVHYNKDTVLKTERVATPPENLSSGLANVPLLFVICVIDFTSRRLVQLLEQGSKERQGTVEQSHCPTARSKQDGHSGMPIRSPSPARAYPFAIHFSPSAVRFVIHSMLVVRCFIFSLVVHPLSSLLGICSQRDVSQQALLPQKPEGSSATL